MKLDELKKYKNILSAVILSGTISLSTSGCSSLEIDYSDKNYRAYRSVVEEVNGRESKEIIKNLLDNEELEIENKYLYIDNDLVRIGEIALLRVGRMLTEERDADYDYAFIDPYTGEMMINFGVEKIENDRVLKKVIVTYYNGEVEELSSSTFEKYVEKIEDKKRKTKTDAGKTILTEGSIARTKQLQESNDKKIELYKVYSYVGEEKKGKDGYKYREVNTFYGEKNGYANGIVYTDTYEELIPCEIYSKVEEESKSKAGYIYRQVNTFEGEKNGYAPGRVIPITGKEIIPCETYSYIGKENKVDKDTIIREINTFDGEKNNCINGRIDVLTGDILVPCNTYIYISSIYKKQDGKFVNVNTKKGVENDFVNAIINIETGDIILEPETYVKLDELEDGIIRGIKEDGSPEIKTYKKTK